MKTQTNWLIDTILSVDYRVFENCWIWLENNRVKVVDVDDWTVQKAYYMNLSCKTTSDCKIPIVQVDRWFKLIQHSFNSQYCLKKLNEKSWKTGV